jgi:ornithine carbamoyltransferase
MGDVRHFLTGEELAAVEVAGLVERAVELKAERGQGVEGDALRGLSVALYFEKPSTRTRISFQVAVAELGGHPVGLRADELQLGRGESVADTARMLSRFVAGVVIRSGSDETVKELADHAEIPVINGLTPLHHPCQALADLATLAERFGDLDGLRVAYVGDGNNVARSLALLGRKVGVEVVVAAPEGYRLEDGVASAQTDDPFEAAKGARALYTDVWVSMGDEATAAERRKALAPYQLREELLEVAADDAVVLHCLPAHPGEEITEGLLYGDRSAVWDQAEYRLHAQKALLELLFMG